MDLFIEESYIVDEHGMVTVEITDLIPPRDSPPVCLFPTNKKRLWARHQAWPTALCQRTAARRIPARATPRTQEAVRRRTAKSSGRSMGKASERPSTSRQTRPTAIPKTP